MDTVFPMNGSKLDDNDWIGNPRCESPRDVERELIARRADLVVFGYVVDADACYSYDDYALVRLDAAYYLLRTSGCSCPSPTETWEVALGPCALDAVEAHLRANEKDGSGYGVTVRQFAEFVALVDLARAEAAR
jgi:hypothetical protein